MFIKWQALLSRLWKNNGYDEVEQMCPCIPESKTVIYTTVNAYFDFSTLLSGDFVSGVTVSPPKQWRVTISKYACGLISLFKWQNTLNDFYSMIFKV